MRQLSSRRNALRERAIQVRRSEPERASHSQALDGSSGRQASKRTRGHAGLFRGGLQPQEVARALRSLLLIDSPAETELSHPVEARGGAAKIREVLNRTLEDGALKLAEGGGPAGERFGG